jgi:GT2 family glycosyltransferase
MSLSTTILITTKDRKDELEHALKSALEQTGVNEILVFDDGSSDGTSELVRTAFPSVRLERSDRPLGIVNARNRGFQMATGNIVITIDDDCVFQGTSTVTETLKDFDEERVGAVAIPYINVNTSPVVQSVSPETDGVYVTSEFTGCASAIRRKVFLDLGGFNSLIWRQGEEYDFCTRMLAASYVTRCGRATPILHYASRNRDNGEITFHSSRGNLLYAWFNVPLWALFPHMAATVGKTFVGSVKAGHLRQWALGTESALRVIAFGRAHRNPVSTDTYWLIRRLRWSGPLELSQLSNMWHG